MRNFILVCSIWLSTQASATGLALQNLDSEEFKNIVKEFSANLTHTSVSGASTLDSVFGFQFGVLTGRTNTPHINSQVQETIPGRTRDSLPHLAIIGGLKIPLGLTFEASYLPTVGTNDFKYKTLGLAVKWTPTNYIENSQFHFAVKAHAQKSSVEFDYDLSGTPTRYEYNSLVSGATAQISYDVAPMVEPYIGFGLLNGTGELKVSGSNTVFSDPDYQADSRAKATVSSPLFMGGIEFKMGVIQFGLEYSRQFGTDTYNGKFTFVP